MVLGFVELDVGFITAVDLVFRTIRSDESVLIVLCDGVPVSATFLVAATDLDAPNGVGTK